MLKGEGRPPPSEAPTMLKQMHICSWKQGKTRFAVRELGAHGAPTRAHAAVTPCSLTSFPNLLFGYIETISLSTYLGCWYGQRIPHGVVGPISQGSPKWPPNENWSHVRHIGPTERPAYDLGTGLKRKGHMLKGCIGKSIILLTRISRLSK